MDSFFTPVNFTPYLDWPSGPAAWAALVLLAGGLTWVLIRSGRDNRSGSRSWWLALGGLLVVGALANLFIGFQLPASGSLPQAPILEESGGPVILALSGVAWALAGGLLGTAGAALVGAVSGLSRALTSTHSLYSVVFTAGLAFFFAKLVNQRYRTLGYRLLRNPLLAASLLALISAPVLFILNALQAAGSLVVRLDYAITSLPAIFIASAVEILTAGITAELAHRLLPELWGSRGEEQPAPSETSLQARYFGGMAAFVLILVATLAAGSWYLSGRTARQMVEDQLAATARVSAESIPYFLETGSSLAAAAAEDISAGTPGGTGESLSRSLRSAAFFKELYYFNAQGSLVGSYPIREPGQVALSGEEQSGIALALQGVGGQVYATGVGAGEHSATLAFLAPVIDRAGAVNGALLGRTDLASNPFTKAVIASLQALQPDESDGSMPGITGMILDGSGRILYHPIASRIMSIYSGRLPEAAGFSDETGSSGTRSLVYSLPAGSSGWQVVLAVPAQRIQQLALSLAVPLLGIILLIALAAVFLLRVSLKSVTTSLQALEEEAGLISQGNLDQQVAALGEDEIGRLGKAFEEMRKNLQTRIGELNRLVGVSKGISSSLEMEEAVQPILDAALAGGAASARLVLIPDPETGDPGIGLERYGAGPCSERFAYLDEQVLELVRSHGELALPNLSRGKGLNFNPAARPGAVLALPVQHERASLGMLWLGYETPTTFSNADTRFISMLAGEAAMAAANIRLFSRAEAGRQRMEAVLEASPDPVLVIDHMNRVLLMNPAARKITGLGGTPAAGRSLEFLIPQKELLQIIRQPVDSGQTHEFQMDNGKVYFATISQISLGDQPAGKVCILRDVTHFKTLDTNKSDFVNTVSHDLRSPLSTIGGYAGMLQMVGELNDQQKNYVRKILAGVENMNHLVGNLLDLGRIESGMGLRLENLSISELVDRVTNSLQLHAAQKNIQIGRNVVEDDRQVVTADQALLHQALFNLVDNAIKYAPVGGKVNIKTELRPNSVVFVVEDNGIGIAPLDQPHVFEKFFKSSQRAAYDQRGSGLGLAIVKSVAERHGGRAWVESSLGKGSTFYLEVPVR